MKMKHDKSPTDDASDLNHTSYGDGVKHFNRGDFKSAKREFEVALECWPEDPQAWFALGNCFDELKKPARAEKCFRTALKYGSEEKKSDTYFNLGNSLYDQDKYEAAIECYTKVSAQSSAYAVAQRNIKRAKDALSTST
jgi:tetratricopeptide (TPR) repeat protein